MGRRYHCEYCNRAFADTLPTRKRHINSLQHQRLKKLHYDSFKDPTTLLAEESQRTPCKKFFQTGQCAFGDNCKFSHVDPQFYQAQLEAARNTQAASRENPPDVESWLSKWRQKHPKKDKISAEKSKYWLPPGFPPIHQLPPSLCPPPDGGIVNNAEWGK